MSRRFLRALGQIILCLCIVLWAIVSSRAAGLQTITITRNGTPVPPNLVVYSWDDYAKRTFGDAWDMLERTDIGWMTWGNDQPHNNLTGKVVQNGWFSATPATEDSNFFLLDTWQAGTSKVGKNGGRYPIDLSRYSMLVLKMKMATTVLNQPGTVDGVATQTFQSVNYRNLPGCCVPQMNVFWSRDSIVYDPVDTPLGGSFGLAAGTVETGITFSTAPPDPGNQTQANSRTYSAMAMSMEGGRFVMHTIALNNLNSTINYTDLKPRTAATNWANFDGTVAPPGWSGLADSLRIDPINLDGLGQIDLDFARLLAPDPANSTPLVVHWTGLPYSRYDVVVSTDPSCDDDAATPGDQYTVVAYSQQTGFPFLAQTLPPGTYYLGLRDQMCGVNEQYCDQRFIGLQSSVVRACFATPIRVADAPSLQFTSPSPQGSADDFATVQLGNAWDFTSVSDIDLTTGLSGGFVTTIPAERPSGVSMGNIPVYQGTSAAVPPGPDVGDPAVSPFFFFKRGAWNRIDAERYRLFTVDVGIDKARDLFRGSVGRLVWHIAGEGGVSPISNQFSVVQNVSTDIVLRHMAKGAVTVDSTSARHVIDRFQVDLRDHVAMPLEPDLNGSESRTGWGNRCTLATGAVNPITGLGGGVVSSCSVTPTADPFGTSRQGIDAFRFDPHEFSPATTFHLAGLRLAAHERIGGAFTINWVPSNPNPSVPSLGSLNPAENANWTVRLYAVPVSPSSPMTPLSRTCAANTSGVITDVPLSAGTALWINGQFQQAPTSGTILGGALVFVCAGVIAPGRTTPSEYTFSQWPVVYDTGVQVTLPRLFLDKTNLRFTAVRTPTGLSAITPPQSVTVTQVGGGTVPWTADVRDTNGNRVDYVQVTPTSGVGSGTFTVSVVPSSVLPLDFTGMSADIGLVIRVVSPNAENTPQYVDMRLALYRDGTILTKPAFGQVDTPVQYTGSATNSNATPCVTAAETPGLSDDCVSGSIAVTGWALDDIGVRAVQVYRQCLAWEASPTCVIVQNRNLVYVGDATFISGVRPDVEAVFSTYPNAHRSGWGLLVLTNLLPDIHAGTPAGGQGVFEFHAFAVDAEGHSTLLGRSTTDATPSRVYANNNGAVAPFGAIDTPGQGVAVGGVYHNFGWALTPESGIGAEINLNGSGMTVFVDGQPIGTPIYNLCRGTNAVNGVVPPGVLCNDDVSTLFANRGYRNLLPGRGAIGVLTLNTATLANGLHSIVWSVTDSKGRTEGIGSRYFYVLNDTSASFGTSTVAVNNLAGREVGRRSGELTGLGEVSGEVGVRLGYDLTAPYARAETLGNQSRQVIARELDRVELTLPMPVSEASWDGYMVQQGRLLPLPPGTSLNGTSGTFAWQPVAGVVGRQELLFVRQNANGTRERLSVGVSFGSITVRPQWAGVTEAVPALR